MRFPSSDHATTHAEKVWMPIVRNEMETASVKKTLTIPAWLNKLAEEKQVNYSQILQAALKDYLGVRERV